MTSLSSSPAFHKVSTQDKNDYDLFYNYSSPDNIQGYAQGSSLDQLTALAQHAYYVISKTNPILDENSPTSAVIPGRQWEINRLSEIKQLLAQAIVCKRDYYTNHWAGKITKFVLKCFGMWNNGDTACIQKAEDFLMLHDSRMSIFKDTTGLYRQRAFFFFLVSTAWIRDNLDTTHFFNYNPQREIPIVHNLQYSTLDQLNPQILIRG